MNYIRTYDRNGRPMTIYIEKRRVLVHRPNYDGIAYAYDRETGVLIRAMNYRTGVCVYHIDRKNRKK